MFYLGVYDFLNTQNNIPWGKIFGAAFVRPSAWHKNNLESYKISKLDYVSMYSIK